MKKLLMFSLVVMFLVSCGGKGQAPTDYITLGQAFGVVSHTFSYWLWLVVCAILFVAVAYTLIQSYREDQEWSVGYSVVSFIITMLLLCAIFIRPCEIAANTTVEQLHRGGIIGY
jgi:hypothetical protein